MNMYEVWYWLSMQKLLITTTLTVIALALGTTTITTTMPVQLAHSQAEQCVTEGILSRCIKPGRDPSSTICIRGICEPGPDLTHQQAGQLIGSQHQGCAQGLAQCTVNKP
jgi:hypothetical protein